MTAAFGAKPEPCSPNDLIEGSTKRMHGANGTSVPGVCAWAAAGAKTAPTVAAVAAAYNERFKGNASPELVVALEASVPAAVPPDPRLRLGPRT